MEKINSETYNDIAEETNGEYPEERKPALYLKFKKILFEKRNELLTESDKYMLLDYPNSLKNKENILIYRQELRNYPALSFFENFDGNFGEGERLLPQLILIE